MKRRTYDILSRMLKVYPNLCCCKISIEEVFKDIISCYSNGGKVLICGNGGSASDSEHIVGELMKGFILKRKLDNNVAERFINIFPEDGQYLAEHLQGALPAISLVSQTAIATAFINDVAADMVYAQQVYGYAKPNDVLIGLSTSGNARNVINAAKVAKVLGIKVIGITGEQGGLLKNVCDIVICVPAAITFEIQEYQLPVYHTLCAMVESELFNE